VKAVQYVAVGTAPQVVDIAEPEPGPGQVLLKVTAAGLCHSDWSVMQYPAEQLPFELPLTLGHEGVGTVAAVGAGVSGVDVGDAVAVYGAWGCGRCHACALGKENVCMRSRIARIPGPGLGRAGALAEYMIVDDARHLVPLGGLDPVAAVPLTDAGLTPYHAIKPSLPKLIPGSVAVVLGAGGLGHIAIQLLRTLSPTRVVALDVAEEKLRLASAVGAHDTLHSDEGAAKRIRELTGGHGAQAVFDFVGAPPTVKTAARCVAPEGDVVVVGLGGGTIPVGFGVVPFDATFRSPYWGSRAELIEVLDLARTGAVDAHVDRFSIEDTPEAYERLHAGKIDGRAVVVFDT
jgi:alcohol dehydrogenase, propanol-preferring